jgi:hypothetical protein
MDNIDFAQFFNEKLKSKGLSLKKLADVSGIPMKHLQNLGEGRYQDLPPAPYLRGYIVSLGTILGFDGLAAWEHFKYLPAIESSGGLDALPKNRFAQRSSTMYAMSGFAALLLVGYLGFRFSNIFGRPILEIGYPQEALVRSMGANVTGLRALRVRALSCAASLLQYPDRYLLALPHLQRLLHCHHHRQQLCASAVRATLLLGALHDHRQKVL